MKKSNLSRATLGRLPAYLRYLQDKDDEYVSAAEMARAMNMCEVTVRKDLSRVSSEGRPKVGYPRRELISNLDELLGKRKRVDVVVAGAGKLGQALMRYRGFEDFGLHILAGFDCEASRLNPHSDCPVLPVEEMAEYCRTHDVRVGVIAVPEGAAQTVCDILVEGGVTAIWNFASYSLKTPRGVAVQNENLALSLAHLCLANGKGNDGRIQT